MKDMGFLQEQRCVQYGVQIVWGKEGIMVEESGKIGQG